MGKYSDRLGGVKTEVTPIAPPGKWSSMLGGGVDIPKEYVDSPNREKTGSISAITGKPEEQYIPTTYKGADFKTLMQAGYIDDNQARIDHFSKARGISPDLYEVKDGKIWFEGEDGRMYPEVPKEVDSVLKQLVAELPSQGLADIGAGIGAAVGGGIPGAMVGAAGGEWVRKTVGKEVYGDKQSGKEYAVDMLAQAAMGGLDAGLGKFVSGAMNTSKIKKTTGGKLTSDVAKDVVGDIPLESRIAGKEITKKGQDIGIDLKPHQAMDDPALTGYYSMLRDNPKTARAVRSADNKLEDQVLQSGDDLVKSVSPRGTGAFEVGNDLVTAGGEAIKKMKQARGNSVKDLYTEANKVDDVVIAPALEEVARLKEKVKPGMKAHSALNRIERMLMKDAPDGKGKVPESSLEVLDNVKQEIDAILSGKDSSSITNKLKRKMQGVKDILTEQADKQSPEYQKARALFTAASPEITKTEKGVVGVLSRMTTDEMKEKAIKKIFSSRHNVRTAKKALAKDNPDLWADTVAEYLRDGFRSAAKVTQGSGDKVLNRAGKYTTKFGTVERRRLEIATEGMVDGAGEPLYGRIKDFFDVMGKASIGMGKESATQSRLKMEKSLQGTSGKINSVSNSLRQSISNFFLKDTQDRAFDKNAKKLLELMQTPEGVDLIAKAKGYGPNTQKGIESITTFVLMAAQTNAGKVAEAVGAMDE